MAVERGLNRTLLGVLKPEGLGEGDLDLRRPLWYLEGEYERLGLVEDDFDAMSTKAWWDLKVEESLA